MDHDHEPLTATSDVVVEESAIHELYLGTVSVKIKVMLFHLHLAFKCGRLQRLQCHDKPAAGPEEVLGCCG